MTSRPVRGASRTAPAPAPGARVVIRDAEWVIRLVDRAPDGGYRLVCDGVSELVREREAVFLTRLEPEVRVLDPADPRLAPDPSPGFADSLRWSRFSDNQPRHRAVAEAADVRAGRGGGATSRRPGLSPRCWRSRRPRTVLEQAEVLLAGWAA